MYKIYYFQISTAETTALNISSHYKKPIMAVKEMSSQNRMHISHPDMHAQTIITPQDILVPPNMCSHQEMPSIPDVHVQTIKNIITLPTNSSRQLKMTCEQSAFVRHLQEIEHAAVETARSIVSKTSFLYIS